MNDYVSLGSSHLDLSSPIALLLKNKREIIAENRLYKVLLTDSLDPSLTAEQQSRWQVLKSDRNSGVEAVEQEIKQLQWQLQQTIVMRQTPENYSLPPKTN